MAQRGRKVDPNSDNQYIKKIFFGKDAANQSNVWRDWPEPQKSIYSRMFAERVMFFPNAIIKQLNKLVQSMADNGTLTFELGD